MKLRNKTLAIFGFMFLAKLCFLFGVDLPQHGMNQASYIFQYIMCELFICLVMYWMFEYLIFYRIRLVLKRMKDIQSDTVSKINSGVHIVGDDEITELAEMFNWMLKEFRTKHDDI
jgi:signal transduction histidine kinase